jgi:hypothetical protein
LTAWRYKEGVKIKLNILRESKLNAFSKLVTGQWSASRFDRYTFGGKAQCTHQKKDCRPQNRPDHYGEEENECSSGGQKPGRPSCN